ncbi:putative Hedgehog signaling attenuator pxb isoform X2 [Rhodnius prolixus]|uniref:putative Hedgehog signaling attenuator pxb isoform X2 n=1 Tax=Rhodnius prolixus TaxID=13249 RepID=UPI003D18FB41
MTLGVDCCRVMWSVECSDYDECPGPPPVFHLPPPPRPPFLHDLPDCSIDINTCNAIPVIDAEYHSSPALSSLAVIVVSSLLLLAMLLIATALVCKHKKRMRNLIPCKSSPQSRCELTHSNGVIYEDLTNMRPRSLPQSSIEMVDVKSRGGMVDMGYARTNYPVLSHSPVFICPPPARIPLHQYSSQDLYNPVYEELSNESGGREESEGETESTHHCQGSEDEFAEDELSLCGLPLPSSVDSNFDNSRYVGHNHSFPAHRGVNAQERRRNGERRPRSLERPRAKNKLGRQNFVRSSQQQYHRGLMGTNIMGYKGQHVPPRNLDVDERLLLDALVRIYPQSDNHLPYITGSYTRLTRHPQNLCAPGQDSDSGYSHNTDRQNMNTIHTSTQPIHKCSHSNSIILS